MKIEEVKHFEWFIYIIIIVFEREILIKVIKIQKGSQLSQVKEGKISGGVMTYAHIS